MAGAASPSGSSVGRAATLLEQLRPEADPADVIRAALLVPEQLSGLREVLGDAPVAWALEQSAQALASAEDQFASVSDLPREEIGLSLEALALDVLAALAQCSAPSAGPRFVPPMAKGAARLLVPFEDVIRSMRLTQSQWLTALFDAAGTQAGPVVSSALVATTSRVFDDEIGRFLQVYIAEREAMVESQLSRRRDLVTALLGDTGTDTDADDSPDLTRDLGIDLARVHTGVVLRRELGTPSLDTRRVRRTLQEAVDGSQVLVLPAGDDTLWAWSSTVEVPGSAARGRLRSALSHLRGTTATVGAPAAGTSGFRSSHEQAEDVATWVDGDRDRDRDQVAFWEDHALPALLALDRPRAARFVRQVLGPLAEDTEAAREHRLTLQAYLESGHSLMHAAQRRGVHRNTIVYRLKRAEELLGAPVSGDDLALRCALLLADRPMPRG